MFDDTIDLEDDPDDDKFDNDKVEVSKAQKKIKKTLDKGIEKKMGVTKISGPFNKIYAKILSSMMSGPREEQLYYIDALKVNTI